MATTGTLARGQALRARFGDAKSSNALTTVYVALFAGHPLEGGVEASGGGYGRAAATNSDALWGTVGTSALSVANVSSLNFPVTTGSYTPTGDYTHWAIMSAPTGGVVWYVGELDESVEVLGAGAQPRFPPGALVIHQDA